MIFSYWPFISLASEVARPPPKMRLFSTRMLLFALGVVMLVAAVYYFLSLDQFKLNKYFYEPMKKDFVIPGVEEFQKKLETWPPTKPKAVIYLLLNPHSIMRTKDCLRRIDRYFNHRYNYPIILFVDAEVSRDVRYFLMKSSDSELFFQDVVFEIPDFVKVPSEEFMKVCPWPPHLGYRHMCRFQSSRVFSEPILQGITWYWRLDNDSELHAEIGYDLFQFMEKHNLLYGYTGITSDIEPCTLGIWETTKKYINDNNIKPIWFDRWPYLQQFYNNFEIGKIEFWKTKEVSSYLGHMDKTGGHYTKRWGDAPLHSLAVTMFMEQRQVHHFKDISYRHQDFYQGFRPASFYFKCFLVGFILALISVILFKYFVTRFETSFFDS